MSALNVVIGFSFKEMGFTWAQSTEALKTHPSLEEAVDALFGIESGRAARGKSEEEKKCPQAQSQTMTVIPVISWYFHHLTVNSECFLQMLVPAGTSPTNRLYRRRTRGASGSFYEQAVLERSKSKSLMLRVKAERNLSRPPLCRGIP